jgi:hypothetical protein
MSLASPSENRPETVAPRPERPWLFQPGNRANPGGRPKGLTALVRQQTADGAELVEFMLAVLRGKKRVNGNAPSLARRMEAATWLADRGFGKVPQALEHTGQDGAPMRFTLVLSAAGAPLQDGDGDGDA